MRLTKIPLLALLMGCFADSCVKPPEYSSTPNIDLSSITFSRGDISNGVQDTLTFKLKFTDGDGDLGAIVDDSNSLDSSNPWYYFYNLIDFSVIPRANYTDQISGYKPITYKVKRTVPQFVNLPALKCGSWQQLRKEGQVVDTLYVTQNLKAYNVNVDVYMKNSSGVYEAHNFTAPKYDWTNCSYNLFRATFPDLSGDMQTALEGAITFRITSYYLASFFNTQKLKMDITVYDRGYHASNVVEKKDFTIAEISK